MAPPLQPIYLDNNATTPIDPQVLEAMLPYLRERFGNPSSAHALGEPAHDAVERARVEVAALIGAAADEIVFTSGGTEASNMAIRGAATMNPARRAVVTTNIEHPATDACCALLERAGGTPDNPLFSGLSRAVRFELAVVTPAGPGGSEPIGSSPEPA